MKKENGEKVFIVGAAETLDFMGLDVYGLFWAFIRGGLLAVAHGRYVPQTACNYGGLI